MKTLLLLLILCATACVSRMGGLRSGINAQTEQEHEVEFYNAMGERRDVRVINHD